MSSPAFHKIDYRSPDVDFRYVLQMSKETLTCRLRALVAVLVAPADDASAGDRGQSLFGEP
jgi:hypothetical protein